MPRTVLALLWCAALAGAQPVDAPRALRDVLDLTQPELTALRDGSDAALAAAYRARLVNRLRALDLGTFGWHDYKLHPRQSKIAELLVGRLAPADYRRSGGGLDFVDLYGLSGPLERLDWLAKPTGDDVGANTEYGGWMFAIPLATRYQQTGDPVYLRRWCELTAAFCRDQKRAVEGLPAAARRTHSPAVALCNWSTEAGSALCQGDRVENIVKCLAVFAKCLPGAAQPPDWPRVLAPVAGPASAEGLALIPADALAAIVVSLVQDHPEALLRRYLRAGAVPNQRRNGLTALARLAQVCPEAKAAPELARQVALAWEDYAAGMFHADGGMLEPSLNYNAGDARAIEELARSLAPDPPAWATRLVAKVAAWRALAAALRTPLGGEPQIGNSHVANAPAIWRDAAARAAWAEANPPPVTPAFGSVAFPYSGYYVQRSGWGLDDLYLFFNGARAARGHANRDHNAVQMTAYGRHLLVAGGPPTYGKPTTPEGKAADDYLSEASTFKHNTLALDSRSQTKAGPVAQMVHPEPIPARWHASAHFDLVEGYYDQGYGAGYNASVTPLKPLDDVAHHRLVVFVRAARLWLLADIVADEQNRGHRATQVWKLAPWVAPPAKGAWPGFPPEQVKLEPATNRFHTSDPHGPNVWVYAFSAARPALTHFCGQRAPALGWFARGIGDAVAASDVHVSWDTARSPLLLSAIVPSKDATSPVAATRDVSLFGMAGCELTLTDESRIAFRVAPEPVDLGAPPLALKGTLLVTLRRAGEPLRGLLLNAESVQVDGESPTGVSSGDYEFELADGVMRTSRIQPPARFAWSEPSAGRRPVYW